MNKLSTNLSAVEAGTPFSLTDPGQGKEKHKPNDEAAEVLAGISVDIEYGYVKRDLNGRHIQFLTIGGAIGTGLFIGIGRALTQAGPLSLLLGYSLTGAAVWGMMQSLGEMTTWLPLPGAVPQFCARYVDEAMGFAVGWNAWYSSTIVLCAEISAAAVVIDYWKGAQDISVAIWISILIVLIFVLNIVGVRIYGEVEFVFAVIKIVTLVGLLILSLIINLGGVPGQPRIGFSLWKNPGAMNTYKAKGDLGRFLGFWSTLTNAAFSYNGIEMVASMAGEAANPRRSIPKAVRRIFWRILFFYVFGALALGCLVPYNDKNLLQAQASEAAGAARSPWVIAINRAGIAVLPSIINAVILTSAASAGNVLLYTGSRYLYGLAQIKQAPKLALRCLKNGVPYLAVIFTALFSTLTYLSCGKSASVAFTWFQNIASLSGLLTWWSVLIAYLKFYYALQEQGISRDTLPFKSPLQPYLAWTSLVYFSIIMLFNGFYAFLPWDSESFITCYVGFPLFAVLFFSWKVWNKTKLRKVGEIDLHSGKQVLDAMDTLWAEEKPTTRWGRFWNWLC